MAEPRRLFKEDDQRLAVPDLAAPILTPSFRDGIVSVSSELLPSNQMDNNDKRDFVKIMLDSEDIQTSPFLHSFDLATIQDMIMFITDTIYSDPTSYTDIIEHPLLPELLDQLLNLANLKEDLPDHPSMEAMQSSSSSSSYSSSVTDIEKVLADLEKNQKELERLKIMFDLNFFGKQQPSSSSSSHSAVDEDDMTSDSAPHRNP